MEEVCFSATGKRAEEAMEAGVGGTGRVCVRPSLTEPNVGEAFDPKGRGVSRSGFSAGTVPGMRGDSWSAMVSCSLSKLAPAVVRSCCCCCCCCCSCCCCCCCICCCCCGVPDSSPLNWEGSLASSPCPGIRIFGNLATAETVASARRKAGGPWRWGMPSSVRPRRSTLIAAEATPASTSSSSSSSSSSWSITMLRRMCRVDQTCGL
mmetsp:Transcript_35242/g.63530  ORF Transcript_35242/g.63530 Transcript_35242/m.63530 type:complete len:207 (+) Transcript_35242:619-1239(+)